MKSKLFLIGFLSAVIACEHNKNQVVVPQKENSSDKELVPKKKDSPEYDLYPVTLREGSVIPYYILGEDKGYAIDRFKTEVFFKYCEERHVCIDYENSENFFVSICMNGILRKFCNIGKEVEEIKISEYITLMVPPRDCRFIWTPCEE